MFEVTREIFFQSKAQTASLDVLIVLSIILICVVLALTAAVLAQFKNRDAGAWFFFTLIPLGILGPIILAWLPKLCEKCGYEIRRGSRTCLKCGAGKDPQLLCECKACGAEYGDNLSICPECDMPRS